MSYVLLEDGTRFDGEAVGAPAAATGEVVFNTAMSGYQESMTDPSYARQLITFTYPHIGNYGVSAAAMESDRIHARARDHARRAQPRRPRRRRGRLARLAARARRRRRSAASTRARSCATSARPARCAAASSRPSVDEREAARADRRRAVDGRARPRARGHAGGAGRARADRRRRRRADDRAARHRRQDARSSQPARARRAPAASTPARPRAEAILDARAGRADARQRPRRPGGARLPRRSEVRELVGALPIFGICLGHQLLCRAVGLETYKLRFGHRGANHPVKDLRDRADRDHEPEPRLRRARPGRRAHDRRGSSRCAGRPTSAPPS